jgi:biotin transporter BioY
MNNIKNLLKKPYYTVILGNIILYTLAIIYFYHVINSYNHNTDTLQYLNNTRIYGTIFVIFTLIKVSITTILIAPLKRYIDKIDK